MIDHRTLVSKMTRNHKRRTKFVCFQNRLTSFAIMLHVTPLSLFGYHGSREAR